MRKAFAHPVSDGSRREARFFDGAPRVLDRLWICSSELCDAVDRESVIVPSVESSDRSEYRQKAEYAVTTCPPELREPVSMLGLPPLGRNGPKLLYVLLELRFGKRVARRYRSYGHRVALAFG